MKRLSSLFCRRYLKKTPPHSEETQHRPFEYRVTMELGADNEKQLVPDTLNRYLLQRRLENNKPVHVRLWRAILQQLEVLFYRYDTISQTALVSGLVFSLLLLTLLPASNLRKGVSQHAIALSSFSDSALTGSALDPVDPKRDAVLLHDSLLVRFTPAQNDAF